MTKCRFGVNCTVLLQRTKVCSARLLWPYGCDMQITDLSCILTAANGAKLERSCNIVMHSYYQEEFYQWILNHILRNSCISFKFCLTNCNILCECYLDTSLSIAKFVEGKPSLRIIILQQQLQLRFVCAYKYHVKKNYRKQHQNTLYWRLWPRSNENVKV